MPPLFKKISVGGYADQNQFYFLELLKNGQSFQLKKITQKNAEFEKMHLSVSDQDVIRKTVRMNAILNRHDILMQLQANQSDYFPDAKEPMIFDYDIRKVKETNQQEIRLLAISSMALKDYTYRLKQAGYVCVSMEPSSYSMLRCLTLYKKQLIKHSLAALLCCHQESYHLIFFNQHDIISVVIKPIKEDVFLSEWIEQTASLYGVLDGLYCIDVDISIENKNLKTEIISLSDYVVSDEKTDPVILGAALRGFYAKD